MRNNINDFGDSIEKRAVKLMSTFNPEIISKYNVFWGKYIGHDQKGKPLSINQIEEGSEMDNKRLLLGQWIYVLLQNQVILLSIKKEIPSKITNKAFQKVSKFIRLLNEGTHCFYNSIEVVKKFNDDQKKNIKVEVIDGFINYRNTLAHNLRPILKFENNNLLVPLDFKMFIESGANDRWIWSHDSNKFKDVKYGTLTEYIENLFQKNKELLFSVISESLEILHEELGDKKIDDISNLKPKGRIDTPLSGSTHN